LAILLIYLFHLAITNRGGIAMKQYTPSLSVRHSAALAQALAEHEGLVQWVVRRQWLGELPFAEALQAGRLALWQALLHYDPGRGSAFSSYAVPAIQRAIWRAVRQARAAASGWKRGEELLTPQPPQCSPDLEEAAQRALVRQALQRLLSRLPARLALLLVARYGLQGDPPQTFTAIGHSLGLTRQRAQQLHQEALLWLAHPARSLPLRRLLACNSRADYQSYFSRLRRWQRARRRRP
jgi:RNA polymerase sigma factor (sigma-70 family)